MSAKHFLKYLFLMSYILLVASCTETPQVSLSNDDYKLVDSMYNISIKEVRSEMDSICKEKQRVWLKEYIDSIKQQRLLEINNLLDQE